MVPPDRSFVRFADSASIYDLNLETGSCELAAAPAAPAPLVVPPLTEVPAVVGVTGVHHPDDGYVYCYYRLFGGDLELPDQFFYVLDSDRDGTLDGWVDDASLADTNRYLSLVDETRW